MEYKYDIAFSFLEQDENIALKLYEELRDRLNCFIYSKRQDELISEDGIEKFTDVFSSESRVVVLLYRENYGKTRWTRIEETAIKKRGFNDGFEFIVLIPMSIDKNIPKWYPDFTIWNNLETVGIEETVQLLINKVKTKGGKIEKDPITAKAERIKRAADYLKKIDHYFQTEEANEDLKDELYELFQYTKKLKSEIFDNKLQLKNEEYSEVNVYEIRVNKYIFQFRLYREYNNSMLNTKLTAKFFGKRIVDDIMRTVQSYVISEKEYKFTRDINWNKIWQSTNNNSEYTTKQLSEKYFYKLLDMYEKGPNKDITNIWA